MDTKQILDFKKQRIQEGLEKLIPPGFSLSKYPSPEKRASDVYEKLDKFYGIDQDVLMQVGYLQATKKDYDSAITHLRFFGGRLDNYQDFLEYFGEGFPNGKKLRKDTEEACDYMTRFYELAKIVIKQVNDEIDAYIHTAKKENQSTEAEKKKEKASKFVSGATSFRPGKSVKVVRTTKLTGIIPKRAAPQEAIKKISTPQLEAVETDEGITGSKRIVSSLGRLSLTLDQTSNNIERVFEVISEDIKNTKELNKKEVDEYRKRVANRGRKLGKRELGNNKSDLAGIVKKYAGSFFSGAGGAIRALALFNMVEKLLNNDPLGAIGPLLGIGATYLPAIGGMIAGMIGKKVLKGLFTGGAKAPKVAKGAAEAVKTIPRVGKLGKFAAFAALGAGALALGSNFLSQKQNDSEQVDTGQSRLDQLEAEQKALVSQEEIKAIPDSAIRKFEEINNKFDRALDILLKKQREQAAQEAASKKNGDGGTTPTGQEPAPLGPISGNLAEAENQMFDYLKKNYGENVAYGMLSNAMRESGYRTNAPEGGFQGMFQWDSTRWAKLKKWAQSQGLNPMDRSTQLRYMIKESDEGGTLERMKRAGSPQEASSIFYNEQERGSESKPVKGSAYRSDNPHETLNKQYLQQIKQRQEGRQPTSTSRQAPEISVIPKSSYDNIASVPSAVPTIVPFPLSQPPQDMSLSSADSGGNIVIKQVLTSKTPHAHLASSVLGIV